MPEIETRQEELRIVENHLLVERNGRLHILDTGVPHTMPCPGVVTEVLGLEVETLIGCAELGQSSLRIDWPARTLTHGVPPDTDAVAVPLHRSALGVPLMSIQGPSGDVVAVLDTGAALSYAPTSAVEGLRSVRRAEDFLPGFGRFTVDVYRLDIRVGGIELPVEVGVLPPMLQMALALLCPGGWIIGSDLFRDRVVTLYLGGSAVHVSRLAS
jgi:hypothetical protein